MRTRSSLALAALAVSFALVAAARPAAAQIASDAGAATRRPDVAAAPVTRTLAVYRLGRPATSALPAQVVVADSAGTLVARYRGDGVAGERAMAVTVMQTDLVLQAETPAGLLTLLLERQNDASAPAGLTGRWWLGDVAGVLRAPAAAAPAGVRN